MLDAEKLKHLSEEMIYALSASQWIDVSWHNAVDGIVHGQTSILGTENGEWRILCDSLQTVSELLNSGEIIQRIHQQHEMRFLPPLRRIIPVPQARFGSPMAMLRCFPYQKMPDNLWQENGSRSQNGGINRCYRNSEWGLANSMSFRSCMEYASESGTDYAHAQVARNTEKSSRSSQYSADSW